jgi:hypothetical protein
MIFFDNSSHASLSTSEFCQIRIQGITLLDSEMRIFWWFKAFLIILIWKESAQEERIMRGSESNLYVVF